MRPIAFKNVAKRQRTVARAYGGSRCANCVKSRVVRAFLIEEQKIVKKVMQEKKNKQSRICSCWLDVGQCYCSLKTKDGKEEKDIQLEPRSS